MARESCVFEDDFVIDLPPDWLSLHQLKSLGNQEVLRVIRIAYMLELEYFVQVSFLASGNEINIVSISFSSV